MKNSENNKEIILFRPKGKKKSLQVFIDENNDTVWASEQQISDIFERDQTVVRRHIKNIFKERELLESEVCAIFARTALDGKTKKLSITI